MSELPQIPLSISHKKLKKFLTNAKKDFSLGHSENIDTRKENNLKKLLEEWNNLSQEVVIELNKNESFDQKNKHNPKSYMALGAMEAHINMAMEALKASKDYQ